ncbi:hypothetical protein FG386_000621 [Cryptosporidium ryanae]|uniref:uncharacterized protein n=1 Tax=Cryptosporidium ryanae TaxID=515981 RepID=UPI00351A13B1|nr:hypothetical protein FG386_000621 [Cryptosporidium ryanae]
MNELISTHGFRQDGRRADEIRRMNCTIYDHRYKGIDSCVFFEQGLTKLFVSVIGPTPIPGNNSGLNISCNFKIAPFSSQDRRRRTKNDKLCIENSMFISKTFSSVIGEFNNKSQITINIMLVEGDGSVKSAAINATSIALALAGVNMKDLIVSATCGLFGKHIFHDLTQMEAEALKTNLLLAINSTDNEIYPVTIDINAKSDQEVVENLIQEAFVACKAASDRIRNFLKVYTSSKIQDMLK